MLILGVDPGLDGALAAVALDGSLISVTDMPTIKPGAKRAIDEVELARILADFGHISAVALELVGVRPGEGGVGAFTFGKGIGLIRGMLRMKFLPIMDCTPRTWQRAVGIETGAGKDASRALAKERFQRHAHLFARVKDDGRSDACLIALWGLQQYRSGAVG